MPRSPGRTPPSATSAPTPPSPGRPIAAFDFDGTLTTRDSFNAFLRWRTDARGWAAGLIRLAPAALRYLARHDRGALKSAAVEVFLQGVSRETLARQADQFAADQGPRLLRPDALKMWREHGARGDLRVIVTASPEETVVPFAARLGADALIGSRLLWTADGRVGAGLDGPNCRGVEKVRRLHERFGPAAHIAAAYGDTAGDTEMLALAAQPHMRLFKANARPDASAWPPAN